MLCPAPCYWSKQRSLYSNTSLIPLAVGDKVRLLKQTCRFLNLNYETNNFKVQNTTVPWATRGSKVFKMLLVVHRLYSIPLLIWWKCLTNFEVLIVSPPIRIKFILGKKFEKDLEHHAGKLLSSILQKLEAWFIDLGNTLSQWFLTRNQNTPNISARELFPALPITLKPKEAAASAFDRVEGFIPPSSGGVLYLCLIKTTHLEGEFPRVGGFLQSCSQLHSQDQSLAVLRSHLLLS